MARRTLTDGRTVSLREDGSARIGSSLLAPGLDLSVHAGLPCLANIAPFIDETGPQVLHRGDGHGADRLVAVSEGFVEGSDQSLVVRDGRFLALIGETVRDAGGALVGVVRRGDAVPVPVFLNGSPLMLRRFAKVLRDEDSVLRAIPGSDGTRWHTYEGFAIDVDGTLLTQRLSLSTSTESRALYEDGAGRAFLVELGRADRETLRITPASDGLFGTAAAGVGGQWAVVGGHLAILDETRLGLAFSADGEPLFRTDGQALLPGTIVEGRSPSTERWLAARDRAGEVVLARIEHSHNGEHLIHIDGTAGIFRRSGRRSGVLGDPPEVIVHGGAAWQVRSSSHGGRRLLAWGDGVVRGFDLRRSGGRLVVTPRATSGEAYCLRRDGVIDEVLFEGSRYSVARSPLDRSSLARDVLAAVDLVRLAAGGRIHDVALSREAFGVCSALCRALDDPTIVPDLVGQEARRAALAEAIRSGGSPFAGVVAGLGGIGAIEAAFGLVQGDDVVVAFRESGRVRRSPGSFQGPGAAHLLALFRTRNDGVVPMTIAEVQTRFDSMLGESTPPRAPMTILRAPIPVRVRSDSDGGPALILGVGKQQRVIEVLDAPGPNHPSLEDVGRWLATLPMTALQAVEHVRFRPSDPHGQAKFSPADGTLTFSAMTPDFWRDHGQAITIHEVVGHGIEQSNPLILRALAMARVLDGAAGNWTGTDDAYGDTNLAESFAVGVQELFADETTRVRRPAFARLVDALIAGQSTLGGRPPG